MALRELSPSRHAAQHAFVEVFLLFNERWTTLPAPRGRLEMRSTNITLAAEPKLDRSWKVSTQQYPRRGRLNLPTRWTTGERKVLPYSHKTLARAVVFNPAKRKPLSEETVRNAVAAYLPPNTEISASACSRINRHARDMVLLTPEQATAALPQLARQLRGRLEYEHVDSIAIQQIAVKLERHNRRVECRRRRASINCSSVPARSQRPLRSLRSKMSSSSTMKTRWRSRNRFKFGLTAAAM
jgi:hypothetical protein